MRRKAQNDEYSGFREFKLSLARFWCRYEIPFANFEGTSEDVAAILVECHSSHESHRSVMVAKQWDQDQHNKKLSRKA